MVLTLGQYHWNTQVGGSGLHVLATEMKTKMVIGWRAVITDRLVRTSGLDRTVAANNNKQLCIISMLYMIWKLYVVFHMFYDKVNWYLQIWYCDYALASSYLNMIYWACIFMYMSGVYHWVCGSRLANQLFRLSVDEVSVIVRLPRSQRSAAVLIPVLNTGARSFEHSFYMYGLFWYHVLL